ncbi:hypothetical protein CBS101457_002530 [Exobasidium rhododendri]|nr:hypothetical protein CBS101457_002530 [Exobasidium rhododendri]
MTDTSSNPSRNESAAARRNRGMSIVSNDPLQGFMRPPPGETSAEKQERLKKEDIAKKRSDLIDKQLKEEMVRLKRERANEKIILLLGQAGAGKTTILKQMRLIYSAEKQESMRLAWTDVVYLNVIMAVKMLLEVLESIDILEAQRNEQILQMRRQLTKVTSLNCLSLTSTNPLMMDTSTSLSSLREPNKVLLARLRLAPFLSIESELRKKLGAFERDTPVPTPTIFSGDDTASSPTSASFNYEVGSTDLRRHQYAADILLRAGWQDQQLDCPASSLEVDAASFAGSSGSVVSSFRRLQAGGQSTLTRRKVDAEEGSAVPGSSRLSQGNYVASQREDEPSRLLSACLSEIQDLWEGSTSEEMKRRDCSSFAQPVSCIARCSFLSHAPRIARADYCPVDDDILHARAVRTIGAIEERFTVDRLLSYRIIDVGGSRAQRNVWAQFFDNATAVIFLAPISAFDEYLEEAPNVNRIADSLDIWRQIVVNPILYDVSLILFLNKMDLLRHKLESGVQIRNFIPTFKGRNDYEDAWRYFRDMFHNVVSDHRSSAPTRNLYIHKTTATSTKEIKVILLSTKDAILRHHLKESGFT